VKGSVLVMFNFESVISNIEMSDIISIIAVIVAFISAFYAWRSAKEAKKANDIGRLNALFAIRAHYLERMEHKIRIAEMLKGFEGGKKADNEYAELDFKLREVHREIEGYHEKVVSAKN
jgi:hypothetical protein